MKASTEGTQRFTARQAARFVSDFFRETNTSLTVSSLGIGTYLGDSDAETDEQYRDAIRLAIESGLNVIDTAINYRCQRSERVIGRVLHELSGAGIVRRDEIVLCSKAGYLPFDESPPASREAYEAYIKREYLDSGVLQARDLVGGGHSIAPGFLADQLGRSLRNLRVEAIDFFYVHNPEQQLSAIAPGELKTRLRAAFSLLEEKVAAGVVGAYGCATWNGLRLPAGSQGHLSLYDLVDVARDVAGDKHHLNVVQLPINLTMSEALRVSTQRNRKGRLVHVIDAASELGLDLVVSAPLLQGQLTRDLPTSVRELFAGDTDAQRSLAFVRAIPGVVSAAVGMKSVRHVEENVASVRVA